MRLRVVELFEKLIEFALLLQTIQARGASGLRFAREVQTFVPGVLLRASRLDAFNANAKPQPPDGEFEDVEEVEQRNGLRKGHAVVRADAGRLAAFLE